MTGRSWQTFSGAWPRVARPETPSPRPCTEALFCEYSGGEPVDFRIVDLVLLEKTHVVRALYFMHDGARCLGGEFEALFRTRDDVNTSGENKDGSLVCAEGAGGIPAEHGQVTLRLVSWRVARAQQGGVRQLAEGHGFTECDPVGEVRRPAEITLPRAQPGQRTEEFGHEHHRLDEWKP